MEYIYTFLFVAGSYCFFRSSLKGLCPACPWSTFDCKFTQQDGRKKRTAKRLCVTNVTAVTYEFCRDLHLPLIFSGLLQTDLFKERWSLAESYFKQNFCHPCHTRFAVVFPPLSCCASSLITPPITTELTSYLQMTKSLLHVKQIAP